MRRPWRRRHPALIGWHVMLHGWWIAIAQNVAPKRFGARQSRLMAERQQRILASCDLPTFALASTSADRDPDNPVDPRSLTGPMTLSGFGVGGRGRSGPSVASVASVASSISTTERVPGGGWLRFTSQRRCTGHDELQRALIVHNFLSAAELSGDRRVKLREFEVGPRAHQVLAVPDDAWDLQMIVIDGEMTTFDSVIIDAHWLALGVIGDVDVAIEGHEVDPTTVELVRLDHHG
jgi:hypothetical protein